MTFDRSADWQDGFEDGVRGMPRVSTRPYYRQGYDRGLSEAIERLRHPHPSRVTVTGNHHVTGITYKGKGTS